VKADVIGWGIGLIAIGAAIATLGYRFLTNRGGMADSYYQSLSSARTLIPRRRRLEEFPPENFQGILGIPTIALGLLFIALGIYGLATG
jgi:hypothetical protein